jgi:hypothetical protein
VTTARMMDTLPVGATARVERTLEGMRVTLRPRGRGRWVGAALLTVWLCGWAAGELFAGGFLIALVGASVGLAPASANIPTGLAAVGIGAFLLVWLSIWTLGGMAASQALARSGWGVDILIVGVNRWTLRRGVGPWGRSRRIDPSDVQHLTLRGNGGNLVAELDGGTVMLTSFGTSADRRWLLQLLRRSARLEEGATGETAPRRRSGPQPARLASHRMEVLPDGTTRVSRTARSQMGQAGCFLFLSLFWNGVVGVFVALGLGLIPAGNHGSGAMAPGKWGYWLFLTPFILVGLGFLLGFGWAALGREEWLVFPNSFQVRRRLLGYQRATRHTDGSLALTMRTDRNGDESWRLLLEAGGKVRVLDTGDPAGLRALGRLLAERTGWPFDEAGGP